jgi:uncharacterized protein
VDRGVLCPGQVIHMQYAIQKRPDILIIKFDQGEAVMASLKKLFGKLGRSNGSILQGVGMLTDFEIVFYDGTGYKTRRFTSPMEIVSMSGSVAQTENGLMPHIHVSLGKEDNTVIGGHLMEGTSHVLIEMSIALLDSVKMSRIKNEKTGLFELKIQGDNL